MSVSTSTSASTHDLMARYCDGDEAAFRALYAHTAPRLLGYLKRLAGDVVSAEDLLQQTFLKVHNARGAYLRGADPMKWLFTIAHRTFLDDLRRRRAARVHLAGADRALPETPVDLTGVPGDTPEGDGDPVLRAAARAAISSLPESQRVALTLIKLEGRSTAEAAAILRTTPGAVKLRAHRAYCALRRELSAVHAAARAAG